VLTLNFEGGKNKWMKETEFHKLRDVFPDASQIIRMIKKGGFFFVEQKFKVAKY